MTTLKRIAFIGNHLPRHCGIATFTHDLHRAVAKACPAIGTCVVAMTDPGRTYNYPSAVGFQVRDDQLTDYIAAAKFLNNGGFDAVSLQHEYGIFGGEAGKNILELLSRLEIPIVTTLHTILAEPSPSQRNVMRAIIDLSEKLVVMSRKGHDLLRSVHGVPASKIEIIPHGIPDCPFVAPDRAKTRLGFEGRQVVLTFGLLSPSKGIETVIDAMPGIVEKCPNAHYVILGATHPHLVRDQGETYRDSLVARVRHLGMGNHVTFVDQFVDQATLLDYISMCDVYVTPYLNEAQMTSGTLAYSFGLGKAVVSTPYWHATELLGDGRGILVPFGDVGAIGSKISELLTDGSRRLDMRKRAYAESRFMTWARTAERYLACFDTSRTPTRRSIIRTSDRSHSPTVRQPLPKLQIGHFLSMCDSTGMLQHAVHSVADRSHGYCVDDNARALLLACTLARSSEAQLPDELTARFTAFIQHAWNPHTRRFRNFMSYDRRWLEDTGSEDSHGRTLWALGECARDDPDTSRRRWAAMLFHNALPATEDFSSPRAWAFTLLGLDAICPMVGGGPASRVRTILAERLMELLAATERSEWVWFEEGLAYDNARLPQALLQTGLRMNASAYVEAGLDSLRWLMSKQTSPSGCFRPIGTENFGRIKDATAAFDQQPVEAAATISACLVANRVAASAEWTEAAMRAFHWFMGENELQALLIDPVSGGCADGLHPDRRNENMGAESALSYLLGLVEIREFQRTTVIKQRKTIPKPNHLATLRIDQPCTTSGGHHVSIQIPKPVELASATRSSPGGRPAVQARDRAP